MATKFEMIADLTDDNDEISELEDLSVLGFLLDDEDWATNWKVPDNVLIIWHRF